MYWWKRTIMWIRQIYSNVWWANDICCICGLIRWVNLLRQNDTFIRQEDIAIRIYIPIKTLGGWYVHSHKINEKKKWVTEMSKNFELYPSLQIFLTDMKWLWFFLWFKQFVPHTDTILYLIKLIYLDVCLNTDKKLDA